MVSLQLLRADELTDRGLTPRRLRTDLASGAAVKIRPGIYVSGTAWAAATPEERVVVRARALAVVSSARPVFSHETAAAIHGLPLYRAHRDSVRTIAPTGRPGALKGTIRHRGELADEEVVEVDGLLCTTLERTTADVARTATFEQAVTVADAALRRVCVDGPGTYDEGWAAAFRRTALEISRRSAHGQTRARRVLEFADGRAQLPGESISRIRLRSLGFRTVILQVPVPGPRGKMYYVDFGLEDASAFGEFDGSIKYVDGRLVDGRTSSQVLDDEKHREDWIRGTTQRRYGRWGWPHVDDASTLGARLAAFGIRPPV